MCVRKMTASVSHISSSSAYNEREKENEDALVVRLALLRELQSVLVSMASTALYRNP